MSASRPYSRTLLQGQEFNLDEFIYVTRDIPFAKLNSALNDHLNEVKKELGQIVNDEFHQFIRLYSDIGEAGTQEIEALEKGLEELCQDVAELSDEINGEYEDVQDLLQKLRKAEAEQILIEKQKKILDDLSVLEDLCDSSELLLAVPYLLMIKAAIAEIDVPQSFQTISQRVFQLHEDIQKHLEKNTIISLTTSDASATLLNASHYELLEKPKAFERLFLEHIEHPFCTSVIRQCYLQELMKSQSDRPSLEVLYDEILTFIGECSEKWIDPLIELSSKGNRLYNELLIEPILDSILVNLSIIFSPGIPDAFQHSYLASFTFLNKVLETVPCDSSEIASSDAWKTFQKSWQLLIYYQLRFRDHASSIEDSLDIQLPILSFATKGRVDLEKVYQFKALRQSIKDLWSENVILDPLVTKFFKLSIQTAARFIDWLVSIPAELNGTELGLSTAIIKACMLYSVPELMSVWFDSILDIFKDSEVELRAIMSKFFETKCLDGKIFISDRVVASFKLYVERSYQNQTGNDLKPFARTVENILDYLKFAKHEVSRQCAQFAIEAFAKNSKQLYESSFKAVTNTRRLESIMKKQLAPEDLEAIERHESLKAHFLKEIDVYNCLASSLSLEADHLDDLKMFIK